MIGTRNMLKELLFALLEPKDELAKAECRFDYTTRLALMEESKSLPWSAILDCYCETKNVPIGIERLSTIRNYEADF